MRFMEISNKLKVNPRNIEHLTEIREFMKTIPKESGQISVVIREMRQYYDILEAFECPIADDDFKMFWSAVFWPRQVVFSFSAFFFPPCSRPLMISSLSCFFTTLPDRDHGRAGGAVAGGIPREFQGEHGRREAQL